MTKNKYKEGDIVQLKDGRFVYLHHDEGSDNRLYKSEEKWPGHFSALFYAPAFGIDCADWGIFSETWNPEYKDPKVLSADEVESLPQEFLDKVLEKKQEISRQREIA